MRYTNIISGFKGEYRWLSNFWVHDPIKGLTVEHHYQAAKAKHLADWLSIMAAESPFEAKKMGKEIEIREDWDQIKLILMEQFTREKYATNHNLRQKLMETEGSLIVEENHWGDVFWGVCNGAGQNYLGKIIMKVRDQFLCVRE